MADLGCGRNWPEQRCWSTNVFRVVRGERGRMIAVCDSNQLPRELYLRCNPAFPFIFSPFFFSPFSREFSYRRTKTRKQKTASRRANFSRDLSRSAPSYFPTKLSFLPYASSFVLSNDRFESGEWKSPRLVEF